MKKSLSGSTAVFQAMGLQYFSISSDIFQNAFDQPVKVSKKHKFSSAFVILLLCLQLAGVLYAISLEKQLQQNENVTKGLTVQFVSYFLMIVVCSTAVIHSCYQTRTAKKVFYNFEKIFKIFTRELEEPVDYGSFAKMFKIDFVITGLIFAAASVALLVFIYHHNQSNVFLWGLLTIFPYFFVQVIIFFALHFIRLTNENLSWLVKVLEKLNTKHELSKVNLEIISRNLKQLRRDDELFNAVMRLKRIYGILTETTGLINEVIGLPLMVIVIDLVIGNISGGYKVYLSFMGDVPAGRIGGKPLKLEAVIH